MLCVLHNFREYSLIWNGINFDSMFIIIICCSYEFSKIRNKEFLEINYSLN